MVKVGKIDYSQEENGYATSGKNVSADISIETAILIDEEVKRRAELACKNMGMNMSTAINIFLVKLGNEQRIPFEVSADPFYSAENMTELKRRVADAKSGRNMHEHELIETE